MNTSHIDATPRLRATGERALVLGGGGATGNAWLIGVLAGLHDGHLDVTTADLTVGTSAGSTAAAQIAGASPPDLFAATLAPPPQGAHPVRPAQGRGPGRPTSDHLERFKATIASASDLADLRRRLAASASSVDPGTDAAWQTQWRATVASRLPSPDWPDRAVLITAIDAGTGEPVVFDRESGVDLVDAVAASCAGGGLAYRIGDGRYLDGGYRSNAENADLATGYARVLVLSPFGGRSLYPEEWGTRLATQVDALRAHGSRVETVFPTSDAEHLFANAMDLSLRPAAAQAGYDQGRALVEPLAEFWG